MIIRFRMVSSGNHTYHQDGSLMIVYDGNYDFLALEGAKEATFTFTFYAQQFNPDGTPMEDERKETVDVTLPVQPTLEQKTYTYNSPVDGTEITGITITLKRTATTTYTYAEIHSSAPQKIWAYRLDYLTGENGQADIGGLVSGGGHYLDDGMVITKDSSITPNPLPDTLPIRISSISDEQQYIDLILTAE